MSDSDHVKQHIEHAIDRARSGVSEHIDEIDRRLRSRMDVKEQASRFAPHLMVGGAALGFAVGFGFPTLVKRLIQFGVPIFLAMKIAQMQSDGETHTPEIY
jgi:hypothetical protein